MAKKTIKFRYYRPCLDTQTSEPVALEYYLNLIQTDSKFFEYTIKTSSSSVIRINSITKHEHYDIPNVATLSYPLWCVTFSKSRIDVPGKINTKTNIVTSVNINDDELITDESVLLYDEITQVAMIQTGSSSTSTTHIQQIINHFIPEGSKDECIYFDPLYYENSLQRALKQTRNRKLTARIIKSSQNHYNDLEHSASCDAIPAIISTADAFDETGCGDLKIDIAIGVNTRNKTNKLNYTTVMNFIHDLAPFIKLGTVDTLKISGYSSNSNKQEVIDLIADPMYDTASFEVTSHNRRILPFSIFNTMVIEYNTRRADFLYK